MKILFCGVPIYLLIAALVYDFYGRTPTGFIVGALWVIALPITALMNLWDEIKSP